MSAPPPFHIMLDCDFDTQFPLPSSFISLFLGGGLKPPKPIPPRICHWTHTNIRLSLVISWGPYLDTSACFNAPTFHALKVDAQSQIIRIYDYYFFVCGRWINWFFFFVLIWFQCGLKTIRQNCIVQSCQRSMQDINFNSPFIMLLFPWPAYTLHLSDILRYSDVCCAALTGYLTQALKHTTRKTTLHLP